MSIAIEIPAGFRCFLSENVGAGGIHDEGVGAEVLMGGGHARYRTVGVNRPANAHQRCIRPCVSRINQPAASWQSRQYGTWLGTYAPTRILHCKGQAYHEQLRLVARSHDYSSVSYTHLRAHETDSYL